MADPLPMPNRCTKCGEWWAQAHVCPTKKPPMRLDCRTCARFHVPKVGAICDSVIVCTNGDRHQPLPPVKLWKTI